MLSTKQELLSHLEFLKMRVQKRLDDHLNNNICDPQIIMQEISRLNLFDSMKEKYK